MTSALPSSASDFQKLCQHSEKSNVEAMARISGFIPCTNALSGEALSTDIKKIILCIGLRMEECRGRKAMIEREIWPVQ